MLTYPTINPVALELGALKIHWYGIAYVAGIIGAWRIWIWAIKKGYTPLIQRDIDDFLPWLTLGIICGGRLGHVIFYELSYYLQNPLEILMIWRPGMAFHGGLLGVIAACYIFTKCRRINFLNLTDLMSLGAPFGLFFGRLANFVNSELWGRVTDVPWAMIFPGAGPYPRHPSQLYEAILEGPLMLAIQYFSAKKQRAHLHEYQGLSSGTFVFFYGLFRFVIEYVRAPVDGYLGPITAGQFYSLPMIALGIFLIHQSRRQVL